jgi:hypothetical protein
MRVLAVADCENDPVLDDTRPRHVAAILGDVIEPHVRDVAAA